MQKLKAKKLSANGKVHVIFLDEGNKHESHKDNP